MSRWWSVAAWTSVVLAAGSIALLVAMGTMDRRARLATAAALTGGDAAHGAAAIRRYGCGACHEIAGIAGARGRLGPPLTDFRERAFIAGRVPNETDTLVAWITNPYRIDSATAMPDLGVGPQDARDIAAYLYSR